MPSIAELPPTISIDQFFLAPESPGGGLLITHTKVSYLWYVPKIRISISFQVMVMLPVQASPPGLCYLNSDCSLLVTFLGTLLQSVLQEIHLLLWL